MDNSSLMNRENKKGSCGARLFLLCTRMNRKANRRSAMPIKTVRKRMTIFIIAAVLLGGAAFSIYYYDRYHTFYDFQVVWEKSLTEENQEAAIQGEGSFCGYMEFGDGVIKYTKDGASYIDSRGKAIWIQSYEMKSPFVTVMVISQLLGTNREIPFISATAAAARDRLLLHCRSFHCPYLQKEW